MEFYCYERKIPFDNDEGQYWKDQFIEQTKIYPNLFGNRIEQYMNNY